MSETMERLVIPDFRLYMILFYSDSISDSDITKKVASTLEGVVAADTVSLKKLADFPFKHYNSLGTIAIHMGSIDTSADSKPKNVFDTSVTIHQKLTHLNDEVEEIFFDSINIHPYALTIASGIGQQEAVVWNPDTVQKYKKSIGAWIEYYSGQWDDYSDALYEERIQQNLSNRLSELHFIRSNSAFIYMSRTDPRWQGWMTYMEDVFVDQILMAKAIQYCLMFLNSELDGVSKRVMAFTGDNLAEIDREMKYVEDLQQLVNGITSELNSERLMNRLHHSTKVASRCFEVFSLVEANQIVSNKINDLQEMVTSKHNIVQSKLQNQQKRWILILNGLIGYQVAFTIRDQLISFLDLDPAGTIAFIISIVIWSSIGILGLVAIIGFLRAFLNNRKSRS